MMKRSLVAAAFGAVLSAAPVAAQAPADWGGTQYNALEMIQPRDNLSSGHRMQRAYPGILWEAPIACAGGVPPYNYELASPPPGMTVNATTGIMTWVNPQASDSLTATCRDSKNVTVSETWTITVSTSGFRFVNAVSGTTFAAGGTGLIGSPWRTLEDLLEHASPGDVAYFRTGTYNTQGITHGTAGVEGNYIDVRGSSTSVIWIAYPGDSPVINFEYNNGAATNRIDIGITGDDTIWIEGLEFRDTFHKFFNMGGGPNGGGTFWRDYFHKNQNGNGLSNGSFLMWNHTQSRYGIVVQDCRFDNAEATGGQTNRGLAILLYDNTRAVMERNLFEHLGGAFSPKDAVERFTFRFNTMRNMPSGHGLSSNMNSGAYPCTSGEIAFNLFQGPFESEVGAMELGPTWINPVCNVQTYRNTIIGVVGFAVRAQDGQYPFSNNIIINADSNTSPYTHLRQAAGFPSTVWSHIQDINNLKGTPASGIVDANGLLQGSYRTTYLGLRGHEVSGQGALRVPAAPTGLSIRP